MVARISSSVKANKNAKKRMKKANAKVVNTRSIAPMVSWKGVSSKGAQPTGASSSHSTRAKTLAGCLAEIVPSSSTQTALTFNRVVLRNFFEQVCKTFENSCAYVCFMYSRQNRALDASVRAFCRLKFVNIKSRP
jgi:hypothetical protein